MDGEFLPAEQRPAQAKRFRADVSFPGEGGAHGFQEGELLVRRRGRVVGDVVGEAGEAVESHHRRAVARRQHEGGDREVLVLVALAGLQLAAGAHAGPTMAWARPFHWPPRPRQTWIADCRVNQL